MIGSFDVLVEAVKTQKKKTIAIAAAADDAVLESVKAVEEELGISECILIGKKADILICAEKAAYKVRESNIIETASDAEAAKKAVAMIKSGEAHLPMKGQLQTPDYLRAILDKEKGLRGKGILSHVGIYQRPEAGKGLFLLTDAAMTIAPDINAKISIINNAVEIAAWLGAEIPKVAMLSFLEHVNLESEASRDAAILSKMAERGQIKNCVIDGPLAFDNALYPEAAKHKNIKSPVAGYADILVVPHIDVGNPLAKALSMMAGLPFAGLVAGAQVPVIMTPRADPISSKVNSIVLCQYILG